MSQPSVLVSPPSPWPLAAASFAFTALSFVLGSLYSKLHWKALFRARAVAGCVDAPSITADVQVLDGLWWVKAVAAGLAVGFAAWGVVRARPRWQNVVALVLASGAVLLAARIE